MLCQCTIFSRKYTFIAVKLNKTIQFTYICYQTFSSRQLKMNFQRKKKCRQNLKLRDIANFSFILHIIFFSSWYLLDGYKTPWWFQKKKYSSQGNVIFKRKEKKNVKYSNNLLPIKQKRFRIFCWNDLFSFYCDI